MFSFLIQFIILILLDLFALLDRFDLMTLNGFVAPVDVLFFLTLFECSGLVGAMDER